MRILLIAPDFYDYHKHVTEEIRRQGHEVSFFAERPGRALYSAAKRLGGKFARSIFDRYLSSILKEIEGRCFDMIVVIRGEIIEPLFVDALRKRHPSARYVMYQWDSMRVVNYRDLIPCFDVVATFDPVDAKELGIAYLPLFFISAYVINNTSQPVVDLTFVGSYHESRYQTLKEVEKYCDENQIVLDTYLYISLIDYLKLFILGKSRPRVNDVRFQKISQAQIVDRYRRATGILDIENNKQAGLTMRTFEALATGRRLVTTNGWARELLPEVEEQIIHIDRQNVRIPIGDLRQPPAMSTGFNSYSLSAWTRHLLDQS